MSLEEAIHQRWADSSGLSALLPSERVTTGRCGGGEKPYATLVAVERRRELPSNAGDTLCEVDVELCLWHDDFDAGEAIVEYVEAVYHLASFELSGESIVVRMREEVVAIEQSEDGLWCWKITFLAKLCAELDA